MAKIIYYDERKYIVQIHAHYLIRKPFNIRKDRAVIPNDARLEGL